MQQIMSITICKYIQVYMIKKYMGFIFYWVIRIVHGYFPVKI